MKPDAKAVDCKIYPLSLVEQEKLSEFLEENLKSGRIRPSKSPMASVNVEHRSDYQTLTLYQILQTNTSTKMLVFGIRNIKSAKLCTAEFDP